MRTPLTLLSSSHGAALSSPRGDAPGFLPVPCLGSAHPISAGHCTHTHGVWNRRPERWFDTKPPPTLQGLTEPSQKGINFHPARCRPSQPAVTKCKFTETKGENALKLDTNKGFPNELPKVSPAQQRRKKGTGRCREVKIQRLTGSSSGVSAAPCF